MEEFGFKPRFVEIGYLGYKLKISYNLRIGLPGRGKHGFKGILLSAKFNRFFIILGGVHIHVYGELGPQEIDNRLGTVRFYWF